ncbi:C40 family peptidase [Limosilactobacillus sp. STM2_1]|uniref:C40 family peptidase n=1 Tax=Limosilactobacillus rudii TaxID=2759755 RepID=A0A7W3ULT6_9LACO|nr:NlpC/P60 family protein [Limosilactobacillus rudii]MBB1079821.1 C40 family peptidase [Limosilactobacillus rudii]MBB1097899.1 C40 family peptidase [Limosilactobacillus rudii]MCD7134817.1 NlpC/P60 family protein [Limosilactobacillus rudii]
MGEQKHYKMFKKGKNWCYMAIATAAIAFGVSTTSVANADTTDAATTPVTSQQVEVSDQTAIKNSTATDNTSQVDNQAQSSQVAQPASQTVYSASTSVTTDANTVAVKPQATAPAQLNGWQTENGNTYYYSDGQKTTGVKDINGSQYYFNDQGQQQKDYFLNQDNHTYYFQADGTRLNDGFYNNWGHTYYFQADGTRLDNGFYNNWGHTYYFQADGSRLDNGFYNNWGHTYYFGNDGARLDDGFYNNWGHTYYFQKDGARLDNGFYSNWGHQYYFGNDGALVQNNDVTVNGKKYHADSEGILTVKNNTDAKVDRALSQRGVPYVWGGNTPAGFDCSGLVQWAYGLGASYRTTYQQATLGTHKRDVMNAPKGSLLFFGSDSAPYHVAISLGNGAYVHAPEPGDVVKIGYSRYFKPSFFITL